MRFMVFFGLKNCFSLPKLWYFLRTSTSSNHPALWEKYDKTVRDGLSKVGNVNFHSISSTQLALHAEMGRLMVLGFHSQPYKQFPPFWHQLLLRVTLSRQFSREHSKMYHLQKRLRNGLA